MQEQLKQLHATAGTRVADAEQRAGEAEKKLKAAVARLAESEQRAREAEQQLSWRSEELHRAREEVSWSRLVLWSL